MNTVEDELKKGKEILIKISLLNPDTRLDVTLNDTDPENSSPIVTKGKLSSKDSKKLLWGIKKTRQILSAEPFKNYIFEETWPYKYLTEDELLKWIEKFNFCTSHWIGSAAMGNSMDGDSHNNIHVVDENLLVYGVDSLRIAGKY